MNRIRNRLLVRAMASLALLTPGVAPARVHLSIGFRTFIGPCHPVHRWHSWYWHDPWLYDCWLVHGPSIVVEVPVVVRDRHVAVAAARLPRARPKVESAEQRSPELERKRGELLRILRIGDVGNPVRAAQDLGPFAGDETVRGALEQALLSDHDPVVRQAVAELFGRLKDEKTLPALKRAYAEDLSRPVRQAAYRAIIMIEGYPPDSE